jgi:hypothetical protein
LYITARYEKKNLFAKENGGKKISEETLLLVGTPV